MINNKVWFSSTIENGVFWDNKSINVGRYRLRRNLRNIINYHSSTQIQNKYTYCDSLWKWNWQYSSFVQPWNPTNKFHIHTYDIRYYRRHKNHWFLKWGCLIFKINGFVRLHQYPSQIYEYEIHLLGFMLEQTVNIFNFISKDYYNRRFCCEFVLSRFFRFSAYWYVYTLLELLA